MRPEAIAANIRRGAGAFGLCLLALLLSASAALAAPTASTDPPTTVHHRSAVLNGHLDPTGDPGVTDCHFEWGLTTAYTGGTVPCAEGNSFNSPASVSATLGFLSPDVVYHYQLVVTTTSNGVLLGGDQTVVPFAFPTVHAQLGAFGPDGTANTAFDGNRFGPLAFRQPTEGLYALNANSSSTGTIFGFDASSPLSFPAVSGFTPPAILPVTNNQMLAVDGTAGASAGNLYYATEGTSEQQRFTVSATAGTFKLCIDPDGGGPEAAQCTSDIAFDAKAESPDKSVPTVSSALQKLPALAGGVTVGGGPGDATGSHPYILGFGAGNLINVDVPQLTCQNGATPLSGGSGCSVTTTTQGVSDKLYGFDSSGNPLAGNFPIDPSVALPVQGTGFGGVAVDSAGHIWITNVPTHRILEYDSTGAYQGSLDVSAQLSDPAAIAFDSNDDLYVGTESASIPPGPKEGVWRYSAASSYAAATKVYEASVDAIAVDPVNHHVFLAPRLTISESGQFNNAVDPGNSYEIREYDARGILLSRFGRHLTKFNFPGLAVDGANHDVYASVAGSDDKIHVFDPGTTQELPTVTQQPASAVNGSSATLNAKIDPETHPVTDCHFEWGLTSSYGNTAPCDPDPGSGSGDVAVSAALSGLNGGTAYHFRIVATNATGTVKGTDQTFTTLGPQLRSSAVVANSVTTSGAGINATVNPQGEATSIHLDYGTDTSYGSSTADKPLGAIDSLDHATSLALSGLAPATTYHVRVVAANGSGTVVGPDLVFTTYDLPPVFAACANDQLRTGPSASLPDCRAYEQASPVAKNGNDVEGAQDSVQASSDGSAVTFISDGGLPGGVGAQDFPWYMARRGADNWSTQGLLPPASLGSRIFGEGWTSDLSLSFMSVSSFTAPEGKGPALVMRDSADGSLTMIHPYTSADALDDSSFIAASTDHDKIYFENKGAQLTSDAVPNQDNLYVWDRDTETLSLASVLPDSACGSPPCAAAGGGVAGPFVPLGRRKGMPSGGVHEGYYVVAGHAISDSGEKAFFTDEESFQIYMREGAGGANPTTVQVSASQRSTPDPGGPKPATFWQATPSGSVAFFSSCEKLTDDSTAHSTAAEECAAAAQGSDLYAYHTATGVLEDLTVDSGDPLGAQVQGVIGASDDGSYVYFVANGDLDGPGQASPGNCASSSENPDIAYAGTGVCNLYVWHAGTTTFIARLDRSQIAQLSDGANWTASRYTGENDETAVKTGRVAADGSAVLFRSLLKQTGYDNQLSCGSAPPRCPEFYLYRYGSAGPVCVSCNPTGLPPFGKPAALSIEQEGLSPFHHGVVLPRNLSADGSRVFFETPDRLVAADTNGVAGCNARLKTGALVCQDVYEWEMAGSGSCSQASSAYSSPNGGCLYLISSGTGAEPSQFLDASTSGDHVFFFTRDQLVPQDGDGNVDVYDAAVLGGFSAQHSIPPPPCDSAEQCHGAGTSPSGTVGAATAAVSGQGNPPITRGCPKGKVRRHGRCVPRHHKHHKHHKHNQSRRAGR